MRWARALQQQSKELFPTQLPRSCWQQREAGSCHWRKASRGWDFSGEGQSYPPSPQRLKVTRAPEEHSARMRTPSPPHPVFWCQGLLAASNLPHVPVSSPSAGLPLAHHVGESANQKATALSLSSPKTPLTGPGMPSVSSWHTPTTVPKLHGMGDRHRKGKAYRVLLQNWN